MIFWPELGTELRKLKTLWNDMTRMVANQYIDSTIFRHVHKWEFSSHFVIITLLINIMVYHHEFTLQFRICSSTTMTIVFVCRFSPRIFYNSIMYWYKVDFRHFYTATVFYFVGGAVNYFMWLLCHIWWSSVRRKCYAIVNSLGGLGHHWLAWLGIRNPHFLHCGRRRGRVLK
jgi:hypothetical protein